MTVFSDCDGVLHHFTLAVFGFTVLPAAFTRFTERALRPPDPDVVNGHDQILISSYTRNETLTTFADVFTMFSEAYRSID